ncbi:MAG: hypothetical protein COX62_06105 [Deltaproteobacteria bacterium CG_4_10_14_0_2_um_filter_43_8]|nr:MAG: hypothetical protein COV43_00185 [Deltaproteobacteria bacterium CG11_big_fil_rev_8_21_14_0_20_42_23]PJA19746.1 MAG: hypothetical protein COX62_06105 [Deltaproteobacteria bacterium CG_4_10_14_0_2_um_filter_43_8]PJC64437.1 MAG: hypothetical protein CO021_04090 [Deltaproteobacteria bacterium CG_4_9_14_0_2_um_filter_42_21]
MNIAATPITLGTQMTTASCFMRLPANSTTDILRKVLVRLNDQNMTTFASPQGIKHLQDEFRRNLFPIFTGKMKDLAQLPKPTQNMLKCQLLTITESENGALDVSSPLPATVELGLVSAAACMGLIDSCLDQTAKKLAELTASPLLKCQRGRVFDSDQTGGANHALTAFVSGLIAAGVLLSGYTIATEQFPAETNVIMGVASAITACALGAVTYRLEAAGRKKLSDYTYVPRIDADAITAGALIEQIKTAWRYQLLLGELRYQIEWAKSELWHNEPRDPISGAFWNVLVGGLTHGKRPYELPQFNFAP